VKHKDRFVVPFVEQASAEESIAQLSIFREILESLKATPAHPSFGWYPYDTLSSWWVLHRLFAADLAHLQQALRNRPVLDIGCGDGDLAFFLSLLGCTVIAVDHPNSNFNYMHGVKALKERFESDLRILEIDVDNEGLSALPEGEYGLVLLLGILYHLKNPFSILETLAKRGRYCMLSTRIAELTPAGAPMKDEALAYLLDSGEANNDSTNFWVFSETGLLRLLKRTGWEIRGSSKVGCETGSNPSSNEADERMFLFLRSRLRSAPAKLALSNGWWPIEAEAWCWVNRNFTIDLSLLESDSTPEFELRFIIHNPAALPLPVEVACSANGINLGTKIYGTLGEQVYRARLPETIDRTKEVSLQFTVAHNFEFDSDARDLGIIIPCRGEISGTNSPISFWIS
jgi:tRNA (mo5U34)-methyltransferase